MLVSMLVFTMSLCIVALLDMCNTVLGVFFISCFLSPFVLYNIVSFV